MDANDFNGIAPLDQTALRKLRYPTFLLGVVSRKSIALPLSPRITYDSKKTPNVACSSAFRYFFHIKKTDKTYQNIRNLMSFLSSTLIKDYESIN